MTETHDWVSMGLTSRSLFTLAASAYWSQFPPATIIMQLTNHLRQQSTGIVACLEIIQSDPTIASAKLSTFDNKTIAEVCRSALEYQASIVEALDLALDYAQALNQHDQTTSD